MVISRFILSSTCIETNRSILVNKAGSTVIYLIPEHVAQYASQQHEYEYNEQQNEEYKQHGTDFLVGTQRAEEADERYDHAGSDQQRCRRYIQIAAQQALHEWSIHKGPHANGEHHQTAHLHNFPCKNNIGY